MGHYRRWGGALHLLPGVMTLTTQWYLSVKDCIRADMILIDCPSELLICKPWSDVYKIYHFIKSMRDSTASMDQHDFSNISHI